MTLRIEFLVRVGRVALCARRATQAGQGQLWEPLMCRCSLSEESEEEEEEVEREEEEVAEDDLILLRSLLLVVGGGATEVSELPTLTLVSQGTPG